MALASKNNKDKNIIWIDGQNPDGTKISELGDKNDRNSAYIKLKYKSDGNIEIGMVKMGRLNDKEYRLSDLMKIIEIKVREIEKNTIVLENDVEFPIENTTEKVRGLILRALQGKPSIYKPYGYKLTNKETHKSRYNNDLSSDLHNTSSITLGIFKSILDNAINLINTFSNKLEPSKKSITISMLSDLGKMRAALEVIKDKDDELLRNIYETFNPELKVLLINQILYKFISTKIKLNHIGELLTPVEDIFVNLFEDNVRYPKKKEEIDNYEIKLNFLKSLHKLYYTQRHQVKNLDNVSRGGNRTNNYYRSFAGKTLRKSKSCRKSRKN